MKKTLFGLLICVVAAASGCASVGANKGCGPGCNGDCNECGLKTAYDEALREFGPPPGAEEGPVVRGNDGTFDCGPECANPLHGQGHLGRGPYGGHGGREFKHTRQFYGPQGPPTAAITYPYYTNRGPRDFLQDGCGPTPIIPSNPRPYCLPSIGP